MNELAYEVLNMLWEQNKIEVNISYILKDATGHLKLVAYERGNEENIIGASGRLENGFITFHIPDWDFNLDDYLLKDLEEGKVFKKDGVVIWECRNCGHIHVGTEAPSVCPVCAHPQAYFEVCGE